MDSQNLKSRGKSATCEKLIQKKLRHSFWPKASSNRKTNLGLKYNLLILEILRKTVIAVGSVYTRVNTHRIYFDLNYVEFTQGEIYSD